MGQRLYRVEQVRTPHEVPGGLRRATEADRSLLASWLEGFATESATTVDSGMLDRALGRNGLFVWQHGGQPVSMAWHSPVVGGVARVSGVYTPPEERGHGYASAVAAGTSHAAMAAGATVCMLYTDLANPTSNAIYQRIGYRPVCDAQDHQFQPPPEPHAGPERADQGAELEPVPERPTVEHLAEALERLAEMDDAVPDGARLSGWFVVAEHEVDGGKHTVLTRYAPDEQPPWRSMGLLRFAGSAEEHQAFAPEPAYPDDADYPDG
jgi:GNAT superfamily N-acetyltransferase